MTDKLGAEPARIRQAAFDYDPADYALGALVVAAEGIQAMQARRARLEDALRRIITPAPGVTEPAPPWAVGIARAALEGDIEC